MDVSVRMEDVRLRKTQRRAATTASKRKTATKRKTVTKEKPRTSKRTTPTVVIQNPIEKPKFDGSGLSPMKFITRFLEYSRHYNWDDEQMLHGVKSCLTKDASLWADLFKDSWYTFEDFKISFERRFWSEEIQCTVREKIESDRWDRKKNPDMSSHFAYYIGLCKSLRPIMSESQMINVIMKHFPYSVQTGWMFPGIKTLETTIEYLLKQDQMYQRGKVIGDKKRKEFEVNSQMVDNKNSKKRNLDDLPKKYPIKTRYNDYKKTEDSKSSSGNVKSSRGAPMSRDRK